MKEINIREIKKKLSEDTMLMCVVKANAYGHGAIYVARALQALDYVHMFGVATLGEGIELRLHGITKDILV